jgi:hypothetical protein
MKRLVLLTAAVLFFSSLAFAVEATVSPKIDPMVLEAPLRGAVTLIGEDRLFNINLGTNEQIHPDAELLILRDGFVLGRAKVLRVNGVDAVAQLKKDSRSVRLVSGDTVLVQYNPSSGRNHGPLPSYEPGDGGKKSEWFFTLALIAFVGLSFSK